MSNEIDNTTPGNASGTNDMIIVIGRQFGSGGRRIGKLVAQKAGIKYYDSELLAKAAEMMGYSRHIFDIHDEKKPSFFRSLLQGTVGVADNFHDVSISGERLYKVQAEVIRRICREGPCVIVGRTADYVMRGHKGLTSVFLHAPIEIRANAILKRGESSDLEEAIEKAKKFDKNRESYYNYYTGSQLWGKAENYSLSLDSSLLDDETAAGIILAFALRRQREK